MNHHKFFQIFWHDFERTFKVFGTPFFRIFEMGDCGLVPKNLKKIMKAPLKIVNQREFFQNYRVNFVFLRADEYK